MSAHDAEARAVAERYARRDAARDEERYSLFDPAALASHLERQRALVRVLAQQGLRPLRECRITEVGCGTGGNLLDLLRLGAASARLTGIELLPERAAQARERLPAALRVIEGDAVQAGVEPASQHAVLAFTVFSSVLEPGAQEQLAGAMWRWVRPGGGVLVYDFTVDNPRNADVRGVAVARIRALFPEARVSSRRLTLAPPLARAACRLTPRAYGLLNALPLLRTHAMTWCGKPNQSQENQK